MKEILLNLLFILVMLFITQLFLDTRGRFLTKKYKIVIIYISSLLSILFCMTFTIEVSEQFRFDLRVIPLVIGGMLGGPMVSVGLYISMIIYRLLLGVDSGFWGNVLNYGLLTIIIVYYSRGFIQLNMKKRLLRTIPVVISHILLSRFIYIYIFPSGLHLSLFLQVSLLKIVSISFLVIFVEVLFHQYKFREQVEQTEKMELISHLSASIAHEVRNGITGAHGFFQLLRGQETETTKLRYINLALEELNRTERIIKDFLTFSKPNPKEIKDNPLEQMINNTISLIEPLANMNSIEIRQSLMSCKIQCDVNLLQQALINIFKNAIEAMPKGGILEVHSISNQKENIIVVKDTGEGMNQEQISRLGMPYYSTQGKNGIGLGMMVTYRIIHELSGTITVTSQVGEGTTFIIKFPKSAELSVLSG